MNNDQTCCSSSLLFILEHHSKHPHPTFFSTHLAKTQDNNGMIMWMEQQQCDKDMGWGHRMMMWGGHGTTTQQGHRTVTTWNDDVTRTQDNNATTWNNKVNRTHNEEATTTCNDNVTRTHNNDTMPTWDNNGWGPSTTHEWWWEPGTTTHKWQWGSPWKPVPLPGIGYTDWRRKPNRTIPCIWFWRDKHR